MSLYVNTLVIIHLFTLQVISLNREVDCNSVIMKTILHYHQHNCRRLNVTGKVITSPDRFALVIRSDSAYAVEQRTVKICMQFYSAQAFLNICKCDEVLFPINNEQIRDSKSYPNIDHFITVFNFLFSLLFLCIIV